MVSIITPPAAPAAGPVPIAFQRLRSTLALPAAASAAVAGAAHLPVTSEHLHEVPYVGWMFVALITVCAFGALALPIRDMAAVWWTLAVSCLTAVIVYVVSRGPGMPAMSDDIGDWTNGLGVISVLSESLVVVLAVTALRRTTTLPASVRRAVVGALPIAALLITAAGYLTGLVTA
jgi:hypothetical protein